MFLNLIYVLFRFGLERELVVHLGIGIHVAYVVVADQGHVTKFSQLYQRGVNHVASRVSILQIWTDLYHLSHNQSKTGVKSTLTSQIKELDAILIKAD